MRNYLILLFLAISPVAFAQQANPFPIVQQKMEYLKWLTGKWEGTTNIVGADGKKLEYKHNLEFANKLNNTVLHINESLINDQDTVAQNIGLFGYNLPQSKYNLQAYTKDGHYIDAYVEALDKKIIWRIHMGGHVVRYTAKLNENGQWHQIGEASSDEGKNWNPFFESVLSRVK